jgi:hypothetical protein
MIGKNLDKMSWSMVRGTLCCLPPCQQPPLHRSLVTMRASSPTHQMCTLDVSLPANLFASILTSWTIWLHLVYGTLMSRMLCLLTMVVYSRLGAFLRRLRIYTRPFGRFLKGLSSTAPSPADLTFVSRRVSMCTWEKLISPRWHPCTSMHGKRVLRLVNTTWEPVPLVMPLSSLWI